MQKLLMLAAGVALTAAHALPSAAAVLYNNGPADVSLNSRPINFSNATADSFTLSQASTLTSIVFQSLDYPGTTISSVNWAITPAVDFSASSTAASLSSDYLFTQQNGYHVDANTFSLGNLELAAGTYYLTLEDAVTTSGSSAYWAESGGTSTAYQNGFPYETSESFQVMGNAASASAVPETATWLMMILGFGGIGAVMRRAHRKSEERFTSKVRAIAAA